MARKIKPTDYTDLKARIIAELQRRNGNGDLSGYADDVAFTETPAEGGYIKPDAPNTIINGLEYINPEGLTSKISGELITENDINLLEAQMSAFEKQPRGATSNNDCSSQCSGMCVSQCTTSCLGTCTGGCTSCTGTCSNTCTGSCKGGCQGCTGSCAGSCAGSCQGSCTNTCTGSCTNECKGCGPCTGCLGVCTGCSATCKKGCVLITSGTESHGCLNT